MSRRRKAIEQISTDQHIGVTTYYLPSKQKYIHKDQISAVKRILINHCKEYITLRELRKREDDYYKNNKFPIFDAISNNNFSEFKKLISEDPECVNQLMRYQKSPLYCAVTKPIIFAQILLENSANINDYNGLGECVLDEAITHGEKDLIILLLHSKASLNISDTRNRSPFKNALESKETEIIEIFKEHIAKSYQLDSHKEPPISSNIGISTKKASVFELINNDRFDEFYELILMDSNVVNQLGPNNTTPLHTAASNINTEYVRMLLENSADINATDFSKRTFLHIAVEKRLHATVRLLLSAYADYSAEDKFGESPFKLAMKLHYYDIASTIIGIRDYRHMHIIDSSLREKIVRCAYLKIGINEIDLIESIQTNNVEEFTKIIQKTPEHIKQLEDIEEFPLHCAVCAPIEFTQILLNNSAQVNAINASKETALHLAVEQLRVDLVKLLLEAGVDPNIEDCHGKSPLILVLKSENPEMIRIFELHSESQVNSQLSQHNQTSIDSDIDAISDSSDSEPELSLKIFEFKTISSDNVQTTGEVSDNCCIS